MSDIRPSSALRYVEASRLDTNILDLDGLDVRNRADEHLGDVQGVLVEPGTGRARYLVIDSGGWFTSKQFVVPVNEAQLDTNRKALRVDLDKDTVKRFPNVDPSEYQAWSDNEWTNYDAGVRRAYPSEGGVARGVTGEYASSDPLWWHAQAWADEPEAVAGRDEFEAERSVRTAVKHPIDAARSAAERVSGRSTEREATMRDDDPRRAPAYGERAQPGDILGIESSGETTNLGDTAVDEDKRREEADEAMRKRRDRR